MIHIALLNQRITIQKAEVVSDRIGNRTNTYKDFYSCYTTVGGESSREKSVAGITVEDTDISFTVRYSNKTAMVTPTEYRIIFQNEIYDIVAIDHMNYKKKCLKFRCKKVSR